MAGPRTEARQAPERAWRITGPLAGLAAFSSAVLGVAHPAPAGEWWQAILFLALFVGTEVAMLHFVVRRQGYSITVNEIPLVFALFYLPPLTLLVVRVLGSLLVSLHRRAAPTKLWFNVAKTGAATSIATLVLFSFHPLNGVGPSTWLALFVATSAYTLVTLGAVLGVITAVQGWQVSRDMVHTVPLGLATSAINIAVGLIVLIALRTTGWSILLLAILAVVLVFVYRSYAQFIRQHRTLTDMYELTRAIGESGGEDTLPDVLLHRVRALMQAESATLWLPARGRHPEVLLTATVDGAGLLDVVATPDTLRRQATEQGRTVAVGPKLRGADIGLLNQLRECGTKDAIVVPLRSGTAVVGCLEVAGRLGDLAHFEPIDVRVLETLAAHAAVALENSRLVERLRFDAYHDALTGLPNRRRMLAALEEAVKVRAPDEVVALLLFDVDGLRDVNDSLGHAAGDKLLAEVARRLREHAPPAALVGRVGGDEFAVTLRVRTLSAAGTLAAELREAVQEPMEFGTLALDVDTVVGVAVHPDHGSDASMLLQRAGVASQAAKSVPAAVQLFNLVLESRSARRLGLAGELHRALEAAELQVFFQPKVSLRDRRLIGVECLARWEHPTHGSVAPEDFVAVAEHTGQLPQLTDVVLKEGLRRCRQWADAGRPLSVAVNLSPRTLLDPEFPARVKELLDEYGVPPRSLTLEITEDGVIGETDRPMPTLRRLNEIGVRLALDDFGTGYSSLTHLRRLPIQEVKIDRTFVQGMATDSADLAFVRAVVDLSRHFGLSVVAEGVESELALELLREIGCDSGQGFLFSRPLPYERLEAWFGARTETEPSPLGEVRRLRAVQ